eukprot:jgi/Chlat1/3700/Chrsp251S00281
MPQAAVVEAEEAARGGAPVAGQGGGVSRGAKPAEAYGFVGSITTVVAYVLFVAWAYLPEGALRAMGITYYPSNSVQYKQIASDNNNAVTSVIWYWAVAVPAYVLVCFVFTVIIYHSLNMMSTPPPESLYTLHDEQSLRPSAGNGESIPHISDIPITIVNQLLYASSSLQAIRSVAGVALFQIITLRSELSRSRAA